MIDVRMKQDIAKGESGRVQINTQAKEGAEWEAEQRAGQKASNITLCVEEQRERRACSVWLCCVIVQMAG